MRTIPALLGALSAGVVLALAAGIPLAHGDARPTTIPVSEIKEGMKGYGLTVFKGTEPERFDVEVIGVLKNALPGEPLILVKTLNNARLDAAKLVHGMSGSPIYLDGRLAGAYAYGYNFQAEPVARVTPIDLMLTEMRRPRPPGFWPLDHAAPLPGQRIAPAPAAPHASNNRFDGPPGSYDLGTHAQQLAGAMAPSDPTLGLTRQATPLMVSGAGPRAVAELRKLVEPLGLEPMMGAGGDAPDPNAPKHFVAGGYFGVQFLRGDVSNAGYCTVTYADGAGRMAGCGHPLFGTGDSALPTCLARVIWINASLQSSFKESECVRPLGTLVSDRQSAVVFDENVGAPTIQMDVDVTGVTGAPKTHWHTELAEDRFLSPAMSAFMLGSVIEATSAERRDLTWKLTTKVDIAGHGSVDLEDVGVAEGGTPDTGDWFRSKLISTVGDVLNNPWEHVHVTHVQARFDVKYTRDMWHLRGVEVLDPVVDAGTRARLRLHLVPEDGPEITRVVDVTMPGELEGKDVEVEIAPGYDVVPQLAAPESLDELLANEPKQTIAPRSIVLQFHAPSQGIAYRGHVTERLPPFTLDALRPQSSDNGPETFQSWSRTVVPLDWFVEGRDKVKIKVRAVVR